MAANTLTLMLTPLKDSGHNFAGPTQAGDWQPSSSSLGELADALPVDTDARVDLVRSTPDPWAQARSFATALAGRPEAQPAALGQWRSLLAILALAGHNEAAYRVQLTPVPLATSASHFANVMRQLLPQITLPLPVDADGGSVSWTMPYVMRVITLGADGQEEPGAEAIAMLNPASLVAPGRSAAEWRCNAVGWLHQGLVDPLGLEARYRPAPAELHLLVAYLDQLNRELQRLCADRGGRDEKALLANMREQIRRYASDCRQQLRDVAPIEVPLTLGHPLVSDLPAVFQLLATPFRAIAAAPGASDCLIALRADLPDDARPFQGLVLLDPGLASSTRPAARLRFWGLTTLQQAIDAPPARRRALATEIAQAGYLMVTPDEIFGRLLVILDEDETVTAHPERFADKLLPLSPLVLLMLSPLELRQAVEIAPDGTVTVRIRVAGAPHALQRRFGDAARGTQLVSDVRAGLGDVAIWPDFAGAHWPHYFAWFNYPTNVANRLRGRFALSGAQFGRVLAALQDESRIAEAAMPWLSAEPLDAGDADRVAAYAGRTSQQSGVMSRLRAQASRQSVSEVQSSPSPFEAVFFTMAKSNGDVVPAGLGLLAIREIDEVSVTAGPIAVDFGTTNTVACTNANGPAQLKSRLVYPVRPKRVTGRWPPVSQDFRDFLPSDDRQLPTPTVTIQRRLDLDMIDQLDANPALDNLPLWRHLIYFHPGFAGAGALESVRLEDWTTLLGRLRFNLKWRNEPAYRVPAARYIRQLMMMLAAEWAAGGRDPAYITWYFSRPRDLGDDGDFVRMLQEGWNDIMPRQKVRAIAPLTYEGDAAATYILSSDAEHRGNGAAALAARGRVNVILDIGGGTTDIAVWSGGAEPKELLSRSIRIAGGDFFTLFITENPAVLEVFGLKSWANVVRMLNAVEEHDVRDNVKFVGELLFSGPELNNAIDTRWTMISGTEQVTRLKEVAYLFLAGVAWQIGCELKPLVQDETISRADLQDVAVALCGRGAQLFARLHGPNPAAQSAIAGLLRLIPLGAVDAQPAWPQVMVSPHPKIEVAAGMIIQAKERGVRLARERPEAAGAEEFAALYASDNDAVPLASVAESTAPYDAGPGATALGRETLERFLRAFAIASGCTITLEQAHWRRMTSVAEELLSQDRHDHRPAQSEYSYLLKALVQLLRAPPESGARPATRWK